MCQRRVMPGLGGGGEGGGGRRVSLKECLEWGNTVVGWWW